MIPDGVAERDAQWHEMRIPSPAAPATLFHNLLWRLRNSLYATPRCYQVL